MISMKEKIGMIEDLNEGEIIKFANQWIGWKKFTKEKHKLFNHLRN